MAMKSPQPISIICHTHWDREWYWPTGRYQVRLVEVLHEVLDQLDSGVLPCFTLDGQTALLADACQLAPSLKSRLREAIQSGKISVGPWFTAPDEWLVCGESLLRNLLLGITETHLWAETVKNEPLNKRQPLVGYLPDTFGHSRDMPTLLNHMGIETAIAWRGFNTTTDPTDSPLFWWQGADSSRLLTLHLRQGYFNNSLHDGVLTAENRAKALTDWLTAQQHDGLPTYLSVGGDHLGPPTPEVLSWLETDYWPSNNTSVAWQHPTDYMAQGLAEESHAPTALTTHTGEALDNTAAYVLHGVWSARLDLKQRNRQAEHRLIHQLEPWWAWAHEGLTEAQQTTIRGAWEQAWRTLLLNHPHDSICGCSVDAVHRENHTRFDQVEALCTAINDRLEVATEALLGGNGWIVHTGTQEFTGIIPITHCGNTPPQSDCIVWTRETSHLIDEYRTDHQQVPLSHLAEPLHTGWLWVSKLPPGAHGIHTVLHTLNKDERVPKLTLTSTLEGWILSNEHLRLTLTSTLSITHLATRQTTTLTLKDVEDEGDSYTRCPSATSAHAQTLAQWKWSLQSPLIYQGHGVMEVNGEVITLSLTLKASSPVVEFDAQWVNTRPQHALSVWFETPKPITQVQAESHLGAVERTVNPDHPRVPPAPLEKNKEWIPNTGPIQRWINANGLYVATQGLSEYETQGASIGITLLRCFGQISAGTLPTRTGAAGPPFETPDAQHLNQPCMARWAVGFIPVTATTAEAQTLWGNTQATHYYGVAHAWSQKQKSNTAEKNPLSKPPSEAFLEPMVSWDNEWIERQCLKPHHWVPHAWVARLLNLTGAPQQATLKTLCGYTAYSTDGLETLPSQDDSPLFQILLSPHQLLSVLILRNP
ncbi:MAG: glycoside hydrolase family 38 C-terminal domain-containing protein [Vampirovibrionales bacterium]|nr:glycoside hydrolase family 38 C-terminal domain-containing protein [Vampirovibrionales bacterium]